MSRCDVVIASEEARFGYPEINVGANPAVHLTILQQMVGRLKAFELIFSGELFSAREAENLGLINKAVPHNKLDEEVEKLAQKFASKSPAVFKCLRDAFYQVPGVEYGISLSSISQIVSLNLSILEDSKEGRQAFLEKRPPQWKGR
jgi:enoyl-CoA hydratase/carnithine racemase